MPRQARTDAPGALQHIIVRGIERRKLFGDDADRKAFIDRLGRLLQESGTACYAWALMPTHVHLLLFSTGWEEAVNFVNVDFDLFVLHRELVKIVKGVSSMSLHLSQSGELMYGLGQVDSTIPDSPGAPTEDWRRMLAVS